MMQTSAPSSTPMRLPKQQTEAPCCLQAQSWTCQSCSWELAGVWKKAGAGSAERCTAVLDQCAAFDSGKLPEQWQKAVMTEAAC